MGAVDTDLYFDAIQSFVDDAETNHVIPAIGYGLHDRLRETGLTDKETRALTMLQKAVANFAIHYYVAFGSVRINETGIIVKKDSNYLPASDKKTYQLRTQSRADGFRALEAAVTYLELNQADFGAYTADAAHLKNRSLYTNTTEEFSQGFDINGNAELFYRLRSVIQTVEQNYIDNLLGDTLSSALRAAVLAGSTTTDQKQLLQRIAKSTALLTIAEAIPYRLVNFDSSGLVTDTLKGNIENVEVSTEGDMKRLQGIMNVTLNKGLSQLASLTKWLNNNALLFAGYVAADLSTASKLNDDERGIYFI